MESIGCLLLRPGKQNEHYRRRRPLLKFFRDVHGRFIAVRDETAVKDAVPTLCSTSALLAWHMLFHCFCRDEC